MAQGKDGAGGAALNGTLRMREVAKLTGLAPSTIHFYVRSGLVPQPEKTGPNQALYGQEFVERVRLIKMLQQQGHLPLSEIRDALDQMDTDSVPAVTHRIVAVARDVIDSLEEAVSDGSPNAVLVTDLGAKGVKPADVKRLLAANLITSTGDGKHTRLAPLDARIAVAFADVREALGLPIEQMMPIFALFANHVKSMARVEATQITGNVARWKGASGGRQGDPSTRSADHRYLQVLRKAQDDFVTAVHHRELALALEELIDDAAVSDQP